MRFAHIAALAAIAVAFVACEPNGQQVVSEPRGSTPPAATEGADPLAATGTPPAQETKAPAPEQTAAASASASASATTAPTGTAKSGTTPAEPIKCGSRFPPCPAGMTCSDGRAGTCR